MIQPEERGSWRDGGWDCTAFTYELSGLGQVSSALWASVVSFVNEKRLWGLNKTCVAPGTHTSSAKDLLLYLKRKTLTQASRGTGILRLAWGKAWKLPPGGTGWRQEAAVSEVFSETEPDAPCVFPDLKTVFRNRLVHRNANCTRYLHWPCLRPSQEPPQVLLGSFDCLLIYRSTNASNCL